MTEQQITRRLTAILAADVAGYSSMMRADETGTVAALRQIWTEIFHPAVALRRGRVVKMMGDGALVEFPSVIDAVESAVAIQRTMSDKNSLAACPIQFRMGINLGDIIIEGEDILGDGINVAVRLEGQAANGGLLVSDVVHSQVNGKVSITFLDFGEIKLKNIDQPMQAWQWHPTKIAPTPRPISRFSLPLPANVPSIAVLPFSVMSKEPEQEFFADGLVEDILTTLSKLSGLWVIARHSSFVYKGRAVDVRQVARELGVRYVLEGSLRKAGNRIRINAQLIDATSGVHVWAERFDRALDDIFAVQDEITLTLATEMQVKLTEGEQARLRYTTTTNIEAWNLWIEGLHHYRGPNTTDAHLQTRRCWEKALKLDPSSATLNALLGVMHFSDARHGWTGENRESALKKADSYVARALTLDPDNPDAYRAASGILLLKSRFEESAAAARKAVKLSPNLPDVLAFGAFVLSCCGHAAEGVRHIERAISLSPNYQAWYLGVLGNAYRLAGRPDEAITAFQGYHAREPGYGLADIILIKVQSGHIDEAREIAMQLAKERPNFSVTAWLRTQFRIDAQQLATDLASLRAAGVLEK
jgi:adenylate cyclase